MGISNEPVIAAHEPKGSAGDLLKIILHLNRGHRTEAREVIAHLYEEGAVAAL
jgi:hypothetical protein